MVYLALPDLHKPSGLEIQPAVELLARIDFLNLEDGSTVQLNRGAEVKVAFSDAERRLFLIMGEANFQVAKEPDRPFVVNVAGVDLRAIGTVFSVKLTEHEVDVIVTEGIVNVISSNKTNPDPSNDINAILEIGQRARVAFQEGNRAVQVDAINEEEIEEANRWQAGQSGNCNT